MLAGGREKKEAADERATVAAVVTSRMPTRTSGRTMGILGEMEGGNVCLTARAVQYHVGDYLRHRVRCSFGYMAAQNALTDKSKFTFSIHSFQGLMVYLALAILHHLLPLPLFHLTFPQFAGCS